MKQLDRCENRICMTFQRFPSFQCQFFLSMHDRSRRRLLHFQSQRKIARLESKKNEETKIATLAKRLFHAISNEHDQTHPANHHKHQQHKCIQALQQSRSFLSPSSNPLHKKKTMSKPIKTISLVPQSRNLSQTKSFLLIIVVVQNLTTILNKQKALPNSEERQSKASSRSSVKHPTQKRARASFWCKRKTCLICCFVETSFPSKIDLSHSASKCLQVTSKRQSLCDVLFLQLAPRSVSRTSSHLKSSTRGTPKSIFERIGEFGSGQGGRHTQSKNVKNANCDLRKIEKNLRCSFHFFFRCLLCFVLLHLTFFLLFYYYYYFFFFARFFFFCC